MPFGEQEDTVVIELLLSDTSSDDVISHEWMKLNDPISTFGGNFTGLEDKVLYSESCISPLS